MATVSAMARTRLYRNGVLVAENFPAEDVSDHLPEPDTAVWLDMCFPTEADLATISEELDLHALAVEDAVGEHQRAKLDRYDTHSFLTAYAVRLDDETGTLETSELAAFVTGRAEKCPTRRPGAKRPRAREAGTAKHIKPKPAPARTLGAGRQLIKLPSACHPVDLAKPDHTVSRALHQHPVAKAWALDAV